tara:strand:- start:1612 stop:2718 length:1107 start_codon:yes stop_codon:yes gene_type:complete
MNKSYIEDERTLSDFKGKTFSGFKTLDVIKSLMKNIQKEEIEGSCYWCAELICSGHYLELWECINLYYSKCIHIANPKLSIYLWQKMSNFRENMNDASSESEQLNFRNENEFRKMFLEIILLLCLSQKKYTFSQSKVSSDDFNFVNIKQNLQAPDLSCSQDILKDQDPKELIIAINDFCFNISKSVSNTLKANYWFEWILEYAKQCKKGKQTCKIEKRDIEKVDEKFHQNPVWLVWDALLQESVRRTELHKKIVKSLYDMFCVKYSEQVNTKRRYIVYFAICLLTNDINISKIDLVTEKSKKLVSVVLDQIDKIFMQVKEKNSELTGESQREAENKVVQETNVVDAYHSRNDKMRILNDFENGFIPRV